MAPSKVCPWSLGERRRRRRKVLSPRPKRGLEAIESIQLLLLVVTWLQLLRKLLVLLLILLLLLVLIVRGLSVSVDVKGSLSPGVFWDRGEGIFFKGMATAAEHFEKKRDGELKRDDRIGEGRRGGKNLRSEDDYDVKGRGRKVLESSGRKKKKSSSFTSKCEQGCERQQSIKSIRGGVVGCQQAFAATPHLGNQ